MKIADLRQQLEKLSSKDLQRLAVELYRLLPKKTRDGLDFDSLLQDPAARRSAKKAPEPIDLDGLDYVINQFLIDAYAQNYMRPNRDVPKSQRPKWRFMVKQYFNNLLIAGANPENGKRAAELLEQVYKMLCHACYYILFNGTDAFESVGVSQTAFLSALLDLKIRYLEPAEFISDALILVRDSHLNRYSLGSDLADVFVHHLSMPESLEAAIARAAELHDEVHRDAGDKPDYKVQDRLNRMAEFGFLAYVKLRDFDKAIQFLKTRQSQRNPEIELFILLQWLEVLDQPDLWLREYQLAIESGIEPRDQLRKTSLHLQEHKAFAH